jgi:hypothetical protein
MCPHILVTLYSISLHENQYNGARVVTYEQTEQIVSRDHNRKTGHNFVPFTFCKNWEAEYS